MRMNKEEYIQYVQQMSPRSKLGRDLFHAFWIGGTICAIGQVIMDGFLYLGYEKELAGTATSICLVFLGALLTALNVYDDIAKYAGAGTLVPITGFSNAVASAAMEFRSEGIVLGTCARMFTIAGPVIVFGIGASAIYGIILCMLGACA